MGYSRSSSKFLVAFTDSFRFKHLKPCCTLTLDRTSQSSQQPSQSKVQDKHVTLMAASALAAKHGCCDEGGSLSCSSLGMCGSCTGLQQSPHAFRMIPVR